jgi:hypothetical protein
MSVSLSMAVGCAMLCACMSFRIVATIVDADFVVGMLDTLDRAALSIGSLAHRLGVILVSLVAAIRTLSSLHAGSDNKRTGIL